MPLVLPRRRRRRVAAALLGLMAVAGGRSAWAAPANPKHLPADAKWYIHLDLEAARQTVLFAQFLDLAKAQFPLEEQLGQLKQAIGVNPLTDIGGVTVFNDSFEKDVAAILIYAKIDQAQLGQAVANNPDFKETEYNKHKLLTWTDANDGKPKAGAFYDDGLIVIGNAPATVKMAIDVLDGGKPAGSALVKAGPKGTFLTAAANLAESRVPNASMLLSASEAATASAGEVDGRFVFAVNLTAKTAEQGAQLKSMIEGVKAMAALGAHDMPTVGKLLGQVVVTADGARLGGRFEHDSKDVIETLKRLDAENKAKKGGNGAAPTAPDAKASPGAGGL